MPLLSNEENLLPVAYDAQSVTPGLSAQRRRKAWASPFLVGIGKKSITGEHYREGSADCGGSHVKPSSRKSPKLKRKTSFFGKVLRPSSSDSNICKECSESDSEMRYFGANEQRSKKKLVFGGQRLSFRKKSSR